MADHPRLPKRNPNANSSTISDCLILSADVTEIVIDSGVNEPDFTGFDLSGFSRLKRLEIGNDCFTDVEEVKLIGLNELESVEIGMNSFVKNKKGDGYDANRHFYLNGCPKLKSLKMGRYSFSDYTVCAIENVNALEVIEMGDLENMTRCFCRASTLELRSILIHSK